MMEIDIIEDKKAKLVLDIKGEGHSLSNIITKAIWEDKHVKTSGYTVAHPLVGIPRVSVETDGADPRGILADAVKKVKKDCSSLKKAFAKELK